jgi:integrase
MESGYTSNPCVRIKTNAEQPRKRYLSPEETARLMAVLDRYPHEQVVSLIRVMFWCGSRVTETMVARWADINLTTGIWIKPGATVKTKSDLNIEHVLASSIGSRDAAISAAVNLARKVAEADLGPLNDYVSA